MSPRRTIGWAAVIFLVPFVELLGRNILGNLDDLKPLVFDLTLVGFFLGSIVWLVAFSSRAAAMLLLAFCHFSIGAMAGFIFFLVPHTSLPTTKVYDFALLFLWISASVLMFQAFKAARTVHHRSPGDPAFVFA